MKAYRAISYGLVWGVGATALETLGLPLGQMSATELLSFQLDLLPRYALAGVLLTAAMALLERRWTLQWAALLLVACPLLLCALQWLSREAIHVFKPPELPTRASYVHMLWSGLLYCGLFIAAHHLSRQEERTRRLLAQAAIAREDSEAMFNAAQIQALQGQLDPAFLLQVMAAVKQRYRVGPEANRLLDALVDLLRVAMPGVRSGTVMPGAEIALASAYARVLHELEAGDTRPDAIPLPTPLEACHDS
ncbi:MAG: hypothetical protein JWQ76_710 [Ramlibacter sp.]|nr:hypothetical protein [Ramlibacter sp.]